ncbi:MAG: hypothetical protein HZB84_04135 [Deltaproteobacteria bacterium]|nr:hypothetical protein [Deltaproteobacteria bacterium]
MKRFGLTAIVVAFSLASLLTACQKKEAPKPQPAATEQKQMTKEDYVKGIEAKLDEFGKKAVAIEEKAKTAAGKEKDELTEKAKKAKEKLAPATEEVNKLKASTEQNWDAAKSRIEGLVGDIQKEGTVLLRRFGGPLFSGPPMPFSVLRQRHPPVYFILMENNRRIHIAASGWHYERWRGQFHPEDPPDF